MNEDRAIVNDPYYGPSFGIFDIIIWPKYGGNICKKCSYEKPIRKTDGNFTVKECEVFQIDI
ncbi:hypothetical protein RhiirA5_39291 [Rhizophagus irregularis]|nr:hypothetical protein RhiirA5_39291 [Rhizophagus irregularis]